MSSDNDLRDAMIATVQPILDNAGPFTEWDRAGKIADAILAILPRWTAKEPE